MQETNRFYSSLSLLILLNVIIKPAWIFGIDREVQNQVGLTEYGAYFSIWNLSIVLLFLLDWGLTVFYNQQLAAKNNHATEQAGSFILMKLLFTLLYAAVILCIAFFTGIDRWDLVVYILLIQIVSSLFVFFRAIITSQQWFRTDAWLSILDKLLMILLCGILLYYPAWFGTVSIDRFLLLQVVCTALALFTALFILLKRNFRFSLQKVWPQKRVFKAALPFGVIVLLMSLHARIDGFLLDRISGAKEAGKYAAAYRLLDAANMFGVLLSTFLLPYISKQWAEGKDISKVALNIRHVLVTSSLSLSCIVLFLAPWLHQVLYHHDEPGAAAIMQWCIPALIGYSLVQVYGTILTATGHIIAFSYITLVSVIVNILLNSQLIPSLGAKGSCIAALASQGVSGMVTVWYARQVLYIPLHIRSILIYIFTGGLLCGFLYISRDWILSRWLIIIIAGVMSLMVLLVTRLTDWKTWKISLRN
ncbi:MAG: oligosaccharide flippase family protein [Chitinophagaceae bacterium]|nr:oligosaccharide flippase family protein [Chitinophagaceae bacterium]